MDISNLLKEAHANLTKADFNAICKNRGFNPKELLTFEFFEHAFLSSTGLKTVMNRLTHEEIITLHLLAFHKNHVRVPFFERIYQEDNSSKYYYSFNEQFKGVYQKIKKRLIRNGILIETEKSYAWERKTKLEKKQFHLPDKFVPFLPLPFENILESDDFGQSNQSLFRKQLNGIFAASEPANFNKKIYKINIHSGEITINGRPFSASNWKTFQTTAWNQSLGELRQKTSKERIYRNDSDNPADEAKLLQYIFSLLTPDPVPKWALPQETARFILLNDGSNQLHPSDISGAQICESGWKCGCLSKFQYQGKTYYGPSGIQKKEIQPGTYIHKSPDGGVRIDTHNVPLDDLDYIGRISHFDLQKGTLIARPNNIKIGNLPAQSKSLPLIKWLVDNIPTYAEAFDNMEKKKGKYIIHKNLVIAKVTDLVLKIQIQKHFFSKPGIIINLSDQFIAFPIAVTPEINKIVKKCGHVTKTRLARQ